MHFTTDFPAWTLISWVLITSLFVVSFRMRADVRARLLRVEQATFGSKTVTGQPGWEYQNYHRAASEMMLSAVSYPDNRLLKLAEAEQYALRALELATEDEQRRFTTKLIEAIERVREEWQASNRG